ncbi:MAG TPA: VCBS repeat-containing protein, partial [Planctomycetaceae bacterium]
RQGDLRVAARCFWESVRRVPAQRRGNYQLGQVLVSLGEEAGHEFAERAGKLYELTQLLDEVLRTEGRSESAFRAVTNLTEATGRAWEAYAWAAAAAEAFPDSAWPHATLARLAPVVAENPPHTLPAANLALKHDYSGFPDHRELLRSVTGGSEPQAGAPVVSSILFEEEADAGIDFVYENGHDPSTKGARMFEQNGGGVAVLDFDLDGWPDLYFTQGAKWVHGAPASTPTPGLVDRLYRNDGGRRFAEVTPVAGLGDPGYGQGVSVGDLDADGFADLYVANIGVNRLYRNNGDGTFTDATEESGLEGQAWTASCVMADLNADGLPDLFDVTYVTGPDVYEAICNGRACSPRIFEGLPDRLHLNQGDGTFAFVPNATPTTDSKGLGVVAADVGSRGRPSLFIANDQVPNHFLRNLPSDDPSNIRLQEEGFVTGLAFDGEGLPMACMGIAADDADGNGLLDFFVTNFKDESNTLYLQDAPGLFVDATVPAGLKAPSVPFVGWGTQFLDADLDGEPDLVVVNGHVDDYRDEGGEYHMRPQFFRNTGGGRFVELFDEAGAYFGRKYLGRGLARLDWNRDGRPD